MDAQILQNNLDTLVSRFGDIGVFVAMLLESSILPIPSEAVVIAAGSIGIPLISIVIFGSLGSTLGAMIGYALGRYGALPLILKYGKYVFIQPHHVYKAEAFAKKYGAGGVLVGRLLPIIPFKVFSIASGITAIPFVPFTVCTFIGVLPRMYLLALFGAAITKYKKEALIALLLILLIFIAFKVIKAHRNRKNSGGISAG